MARAERRLLLGAGLAACAALALALALAAGTVSRLALAAGPVPLPWPPLPVAVDPPAERASEPERNYQKPPKPGVDRVLKERAPRAERAEVEPKPASPAPAEREPQSARKPNGGLGGFGFGKPSITIHAWRPLAEPPEAAWTGRRTGLYTYVLVGDVGDAALARPGAQALQARQALEVLLREVQGLQPVAAIREEDLLLRANQFCVPARAGRDGGTGLANYDFGLAAQFLNRFKLAAEPLPEMAARLDGVGPFLLATRKPIGEILTRGGDGALRVDVDSPILLIDLGGRHPLSVPVYVEAFRQAVRQVGRRDGSAVLQPLRPLFASAVLQANEALPFVAEAYAGTRRLFEGGGKQN